MILNQKIEQRGWYFKETIFLNFLIIVGLNGGICESICKWLLLILMVYFNEMNHWNNRKWF